MARVLVLSHVPIFPTNGGGRVRIHAIASRLAAHHEVSVLCPRDGTPAAPPPFTLYDRGIRGWQQLARPRTLSTALDVVRDVRPDVILLEYIWQGMHALALRLKLGVPVILDAFDVVTLRLRRAGQPWWPVASAYERAVLRSVNRVFATSEYDREHLVRLGAREASTQVVPNGVDVTVFRPDEATGRATREKLNAGADDRLLLFFGQLDYAPNRQAVEDLVKHVLPRLGEEYRLVVAGRGQIGDLRRHEGKRTRFLGPVEPLPAYINAADAVVAPIRSGSGTRLKVLESIACGTPTVTTPLGAEGIDVAACGAALTIASGWDAFAEAVRTAAARGLTPPAPSFTDTYDWEAIVRGIELT
jgi:polysaccharide biosynthesis protein PslH